MKGKITMLFAGDFLPPRTSSNNVFSDALLTILQDKDVDFSIVNLESPLTNSTKKISKTGNHYKRPPESVAHLKAGHFDAVTLSNNHIRDFGCQGVKDTIDVCRKNSVLTVGAGDNIENAVAPLQVTLQGQKVSLLNYSEKEFNLATETRAGANPYNSISAYYDIQEQKKDNDYVIIIYHGGLEYHHYPTRGVIDRFKFMIDAGADCIVSHHTHRYSGIITHKTKPILFGLGNFLSPTKAKLAGDWRTGLVAKIELGERSIRSQFLPSRMSNDFSCIDILTGDEKQKVLEHVHDISRNICDNKFIEKYWKKSLLDGDNLAVMINSDSLFEYRLRKKLSYIFKNNISTHKLLFLLNIIRCSSHRENILEILEERYNQL